MTTPAPRATALEIPLYREINDCHAATGVSLRTDLPAFHVFSFDEIYAGMRAAMPPYRRGFYQLTYLETQTGPGIAIDSEPITARAPLLLFAAPEQVLSWVRGEPERGFTLYFKAELFPARTGPLEEAFPFFSRFERNALALEPGDREVFRPQFERMRALFQTAHPYRLPQLAALTTALLYDCRVRFDREQSAPSESCAGSALVTRFQQMIWQCSLSDRVVEDYAKCLHVSADHLSAMVKEHTGRTPRDFIAERVMHEAKRLLRYTDLNVSEITDHLQFSEPTHFTRFFKRHTQLTPLEFRRELRTGQETFATPPDGNSKFRFASEIGRFFPEAG